MDPSIVLTIYIPIMSCYHVVIKHVSTTIMYIGSKLIKCVGETNCSIIQISFIRKYIAVSQYRPTIKENVTPTPMSK